MLIGVEGRADNVRSELGCAVLGRVDSVRFVSAGRALFGRVDAVDVLVGLAVPVTVVIVALVAATVIGRPDVVRACVGSGVLGRTELVLGCVGSGALGRTSVTRAVVASATESRACDGGLVSVGAVGVTRHCCVPPVASTIGDVKRS